MFNAQMTVGKGITLTLALSHQGRGDKGAHKGRPYGVMGWFEFGFVRIRIWGMMGFAGWGRSCLGVACGEDADGFG